MPGRHLGWEFELQWQEWGYGLPLEDADKILGQQTPVGGGQVAGRRQVGTRERSQMMKWTVG
jgi:hypothetical protein